MKIILNGAAGRMGKILADMAGNEKIAARVDVALGNKLTDFDFSGNNYCVVDFSNHSATRDLINYCVDKNLPLLIASTGHNDDEIKIIHDAAKKIPVFMSANMSLGIALLADIAQRITENFGACDIEIIEAHHNQKLDVPSGTALLLADRIRESRKLDFNIGRHENGKRPENELGIHSLRYGAEVGMHEIIFATPEEKITIKHEANNRALFARGALKAAEWIVNQKPGFYNMRDLLRSN